MAPINCSQNSTNARKAYYYVIARNSEFIEIIKDGEFDKDSREVLGKVPVRLMKTLGVKKDGRVKGAQITPARFMTLNESAHRRSATKLEMAATTGKLQNTRERLSTKRHSE